MAIAWIYIDTVSGRMQIYDGRMYLLHLMLNICLQIWMGNCVRFIICWFDIHSDITTHFEKVDSSLQQCWQHQSVRALFYAEPQLGLALPLPLADNFWPFLAIFRLFQVFQSISGYSKLFRYIPGYSMSYQAITGFFNLSQSIGVIP